MPSPDFFARFGFLIIRRFLNTRLCMRLRGEMGLCQDSPATIIDPRHSYETVVESVRKTRCVNVSAASSKAMRQQLRRLKPQVEAHFNRQLEDFERPQFLIYKPGDYFLAHTDRGESANVPEAIRRRSISVVVFLDEQAGPSPDSYSGGDLIFYGLIKDAGWEKYGFQLTPEAGLMVAFQSDVLHEVTPVLGGSRHTLVTWFY